MPDFTNLPPPASKTTEEQWQVYLNQPHPVSTNLLPYMRNYTGGEHGQHPVHTMYPVSVPHPSHRQYAQVELAKRRMAQEQQRQQIQRRNPVRVATEQTGFILPQHHPDLLQFRPDMGNFTGKLKIRMPRFRI